MLRSNPATSLIKLHCMLTRAISRSASSNSRVLLSKNHEWTVETKRMARRAWCSVATSTREAIVITCSSGNTRVRPISQRKSSRRLCPKARYFFTWAPPYTAVAPIGLTSRATLGNYSAPDGVPDASHPGRLSEPGWHLVRKLINRNSVYLWAVTYRKLDR